MIFLFYGIRFFFSFGAPALVKTVGEDLTSAGDMIRDRREKRLKMGIAVTIFRFFAHGIGP